jgi:chaperonin GroES
MKIKPLADRIVVKRLAAEAKTAGGILLPDSAKEKPKEGKVISVGEGRLLEDGSRGKINLKKGDHVLFTSYAGTEIQVDGEDMLIMNESDVLAVMSK